jgi:hypothetical protein
MKFCNKLAIAVCVSGVMSGASLRIASAVIGPEALSAVVGNTLVQSIRSDGEIFIFIDKDGSWRSIFGDQRRSGKWSFSDRKFCFSDTPDIPALCSEMDVAGDQVTMPYPQKAEKFKLLSGNPKSL